MVRILTPHEGEKKQPLLQRRSRNIQLSKGHKMIFIPRGRGEVLLSPTPGAFLSNSYVHYATQAIMISSFNYVTILVTTTTTTTTKMIFKGTYKKTPWRKEEKENEITLQYRFYAYIVLSRTEKNMQ